MLEEEKAYLLADWVMMLKRMREGERCWCICIGQVTYIYSLST